MRYVVEPAMVAHLWAHQSQDSARNSGGNFYFNGKDIYFYGSHFRCASIETNRLRERAYLVTTRTYSNTTATHMNMIRNAIPGYETVFYTPRSVTLRNGKMYKYDYCEAAYYIVDQLEKINESINAQKKARTQNYTDQVEDCLLNIGRWIAFWGLDKRQKAADGKWLMPVLDKLCSARKQDKKDFWKITGERSRYNNYTPRYDKSEYQELLQDILSRGLIQSTAIGGFEERVSQLFIDRSGDPLLWERFEERKERQEEINRHNAELREQRWAEQWEKRRREDEERQRIARMTFDEKKELWYSGELSNIWFSIPSGLGFNALLRVRNGYIETSKGIRVEAMEAARLWKLVELFHKNETNFRHDLIKDANSHQWSINSYQNDILTAGCHRISYDEMRNAARQLGIAA